MRCVLAELKTQNQQLKTRQNNRKKQANQARREERYRITNNWPKNKKKKKNSRNEMHSKKVRKT